MSHPPWQKNVGIQNFQQQMSLQFNQQLNAAASYGFQQQNFANLAGMNLNLQPSPIQYPPRVNAIAFQQQQPSSQPQSSQMQSSQQSSNSKYNQNIKTFSGTGTVTKLQNDIGFIDDEVLFHKNVCVNGVPKVRDLVLVEATFNAKMPFKWNATRVQILSAHTAQTGTSSSSSMQQENKSYNSSTGSQRDSGADNSRRNRYSEDRDRRGREERRPRSREHNRDDDSERKRRREDERSERDRRTAERRQTKSPKRRRTAIVPRYNVQMPKISLSLINIDVLEARRRYPNLYVPSDFLFSENKWHGAFQPQKPFTLNRPCSFHIMKDVAPIDECVEKTVLDPPDADYSYSAKVMLMSLPTIEEIYKKCIVKAEDKEDDHHEKDFIHPTRLISFLVGVRGKNDTMAIGGPWSKKLDGENPEGDPSVLIKTAIRTCKALTGIDLSRCTQWYRFLELKYRRSEQTKGETIVKPARIETVVIFLPDIYSCMPNRSEWETLQQQYKQACEKFLSDPDSDDDVQIISADDEKSQTTVDQPVLVESNVGGVSVDANENSSSDKNGESSTTCEALSSQQSASNNDEPMVEASQDAEGATAEENAMPIDDCVEGKTECGEESSLMQDIKNLKVTELRAELAARNLSTKGLKHELIERLQNVLNDQSSEITNLTAQSSEQNTDVEMTTESIEQAPVNDNDDSKEQDSEMNIAEMDMSEVTVIDEYDSTKDDKPKQSGSADAKKKKQEAKKKKFDDKEKKDWEKKYQLPDNSPAIIVHPSKTAKGGKFDCTVVSLSLLLDYSTKDTKEHSFEISLFAEAFNEMLTRDLGFKIYKAFNILSGINVKEEKPKETNDEGDKSEDQTKSESGDKKGSSSKKNNEDSDSDQSRSRREKDSKDKIKSVTAYPDLLLSFCYFDQSQCGYIFEKDMEELFYCLGLSLSRSQVRKLLEKFITRDSLYYRKITDRPATAVVESDPLENISDEQLAILARGNNRIADTSNVSQSSANNEIVTVDGITVNVQQILNQMKRAESAYEESERNVQELRKSNSELKSTNHKNEKKIKDLNSDLKSYSRKLQDAESGLSSMTRKYNDCFSVISSVYDRVTPIIRSKERSRDRDRKSDKKSVKEEKSSEKSEKKVEKPPVVEEKEIKEETTEVKEEQKPEENKPVEEEKQIKEELT